MKTIGLDSIILPMRTMRQGADFMNKHQCQLERLCQKFLIRYGVDDQLVLELHAELAKCKLEEGAMNQAVLRNFQPHEVHTLSSAKLSH